MSPAAPTKRRSIQLLKSQVVDQVLEQELGELSGSKRLIHSSLKITVMVAQDFFQHLVKLQAQALSFKTLLSLAPLLVLMAGWPLAVLALLPDGLVAALAADLGVGDALHLLAWMGVVPATLMLGLSAVSRRWLPKNIFSYIFGRGFIGTFVATALAGAATLWMQATPSPADLEGLFVARLLTSFGEAFICGLLIASLVAFRPMLLATYADRLYLSR